MGGRAAACEETSGHSCQRVETVSITSAIPAMGSPSVFESAREVIGRANLVEPSTFEPRHFRLETILSDRDQRFTVNASAMAAHHVWYLDTSVNLFSVNSHYKERT